MLFNQLSVFSGEYGVGTASIASSKRCFWQLKSGFLFVILGNLAEFWQSFLSIIKNKYNQKTSYKPT